jgi:hypothetical protein
MTTRMEYWSAIMIGPDEDFGGAPVLRKGIHP